MSIIVNSLFKTFGGETCTRARSPNTFVSASNGGMLIPHPLVRPARERKKLSGHTLASALFIQDSLKLFLLQFMDKTHLYVRLPGEESLSACFWYH